MINFISIIIVGFLVLSGSGAITFNYDDLKSVNNYIENNQILSNDYTHTVFVEVATAQFCDPCSNWSPIIYDIYNSGQYDFEYIEMIVYGHGGHSDILNDKAYAWKNLYDVPGTPTSILDGNYRMTVGTSSNQLKNKLNECGDRNVKDLEASLIVTWLGDAKIQIEIMIINHEATEYNGYIRVPIAEITSRYNTASGEKYHYGFLDYAVTMNTVISIPSGGIYTNIVTWNGNEHQDNHGDDFGDITEENIKVFLGVFNNFDGYIDVTAAALVDENQPPYKPNIEGPAIGETEVEYEYTFVVKDPEEDDIWIYIDWDDGQVEDWSGPFISDEEIIIYHKFSETGTHELTAKARDIDNNEGDWANPFIVNIGNLPPNTPEISGPTTGKTGESYNYTISTVDPEDDDVYYWIEWFEGCPGIYWHGPHSSGEKIVFSNTWDKPGEYIIGVTAKDIYNATSDTVTLKVTIPRNKAFNSNLFTFLYERFAKIRQILTSLN